MHANPANLQRSRLASDDEKPFQVRTDVAAHRTANRLGIPDPSGIEVKQRYTDTSPSPVPVRRESAARERSREIASRCRCPPANDARHLAGSHDEPAFGVAKKDSVCAVFVGAGQAIR